MWDWMQQLGLKIRRTPKKVKTAHRTVQYSIPHSPVLNIPQSSNKCPTVQHSVPHSTVLNTPQYITQYLTVQYSITHSPVLNTPQSSIQYPLFYWPTLIIYTHILLLCVLFIKICKEMCKAARDLTLQVISHCKGSHIARDLTLQGISHSVTFHVFFLINCSIMNGLMMAWWWPDHGLIMAWW
jgi:hypothetical protein